MIYKKSKPNCQIIETSQSKSMNSSESTSSHHFDKDAPPTRRRNYKKKENFNTETVTILNHWIMNNIEYPYPNKSDCEQLSQLTGLSHKQIRVWCTNTRKRRLKVNRNDSSFFEFHDQLLKYESNSTNMNQTPSFNKMAAPPELLDLKQATLGHDLFVKDLTPIPSTCYKRCNSTFMDVAGRNLSKSSAKKEQKKAYSDLLEYLKMNYCSCGLDSSQI